MRKDIKRYAGTPWQPLPRRLDIDLNCHLMVSVYLIKNRSCPHQRSFKLSSDLDSQTERVRLLAIDFRKAIDHALKAGDFYRSVIASFSIGFCGYTSDLLQRYLGEKGIATRYVSGTYHDSSTDDSQSHAWLELTNGTIVDITGDQFRNKLYPLQNDCPVYCGKSNAFYNFFELALPCQCEDTYSMDIKRKEKLAFDNICTFL